MLNRNVIKIIPLPNDRISKTVNYCKKKNTKAFVQLIALYCSSKCSLETERKRFLNQLLNAG
jgi:hypothetical protein